MAKKKSKKASPEKRRKVRTALAKLKKAGVLSPRFNVRSAPLSKKNLNLIEEYKGVIDGRLRTVKLPKAKVAINREDGLRTVRDRVIVENSPGSKVVFKKKDPYGFAIRHADVSGIKAIEFHGGKNALDKYAEYAAKEISKGNAVGFTVDGYRSKLLFNSPEQAVEYFRSYQGKDKISTFTIYEVPRSQAYKWGTRPAKSRTKRRKK